MKVTSVEFNRCAGLGNKLFPWARAKIFSRNQGCRMLRTHWFSPHGGGIVRGGVEYQRALSKIWLYRNFKSSKEEMSKLEYFIKFHNLPLLKVRNLCEADAAVDHNGNICFRWDTCHDFAEFAGEQDFLRQSIEHITIDSQLSFANKYKNMEFIGLNIRCGNDFVSAESGGSRFVKTGQDWFCEALSIIRKEYGNMPAIIVSDGGRAQLGKLLCESNVQLLQSSTAIADLLVLSKARVLLGSGNSTFSAWASFLGEMDTFSSPKTPFLCEGLKDGRAGAKVVGVI